MRYLICVLLFASPVYAQSKINLHSGTILVGETKVLVWPIQTSFGLLKIPVEEIRGIEVGLHYDEGVKAGIEKAIKALGSDVYKEREIAQKDLIQYGKYAVPFLSRKHGDMEISSRFKVALEQIVTNNSASDKFKTYDVIRTSEGDFRGQIQINEIEITHPDYGSAKVKLSAISKIATNSVRLMEFEIKATPEWIDSGIHFEWGMKCNIRAEGRVELWPQGPGQYIANPEGLNNTAGRGGIGLAGQLMVKIGEAGTPMSLKVFNDSTSLQRAGQLMFLIVPNPWNTPSEGFYRVTVKGE